ncbi:MAG: winged helix DNA-binding domain-containing protein [Acidimicrobiia bacterium]
MLLERAEQTPAEAMEVLVGMQAQNPHDPYYALWSRLEGFDPQALSGMLERREALRGALMRATLHMSTTSDFLFLRSHLQATLAAVLGSTSFAKDTAGLDRAVLLDQGKSLLDKRPMTRADLARALEEKWPNVPGTSMAQVVTYLLPVIQVPPRGLWGRTGAATWTTIEGWIGSGLPAMRDHEQIVLRYLAAFGPATISDIRVWSRLNGLRQVVDGMRERLRTLRGPDGSDLLDLPDAPILDEDTPAPPRFLPEYDNVLLGHSDRSRFFTTGIVPPGWVGNLLVEGMFSGWWKMGRTGKTSKLEVHLLRKVPRAQVKALGQEAERLHLFAVPDAGHQAIEIYHDA